MRRCLAASLTLLASLASAQHATVPSRGGTVTSGNATSGFTANTLVLNASGVLASGPKFLSGNLSLEVGTNYCPDAGANDTYVCTLQGGSLAAYSTGTKITLKANTANTGTATVAVDGLAAITITRRDDSTLQTGDISAGEAVELWYDGNTFRMQGGFSSGLTYASNVLTTTGNLNLALVSAAYPVKYLAAGFSIIEASSATALAINEGGWTTVRIKGAVSLGGTSTATGSFPAGGGFVLTTGTKPTCDSSVRGMTYYVAGGAGVADTYEVCRKDAGDAYAWVSIF